MSRAGATIVLAAMTAAAAITGCARTSHREAADVVSANSNRVAARNQLPPIELARRFWVAYVNQDEQAIRRYCLANPDLHYTWERTVVFPQSQADYVIRTVGSCPGRVLKPGDRFTSNQRVLEMEQYDPNVYCPVYLEWPVEPLFLPCHRSDDAAAEWRVDAGAWIAALKAVDRVRRQRAAAASFPFVSGADRLREDPERTVRNFMITMCRGDREGVGIRAFPDPGLGWFLENMPVAATHERAMLQALFEELPVEPMKVGEDLGDPFTPGQQVHPAMVDTDHLVLRMRTKGPAFWSHLLVRYQNRWFVDMRMHIEAMKQMRAATQPMRAN